MEHYSRNDFLSKIEYLEDEIKEKEKLINVNKREINKQTETINELRLHTVKLKEYEELNEK